MLKGRKTITKSAMDKLYSKISTERNFPVVYNPKKNINNNNIKLFEKRVGNSFYVIFPTNKGYSQVLFQENIGDTSDASIGVNWGLLRNTKAEYVYDAFVCVNTVSASTSTTLNFGPAGSVASNIERYLVYGGHSARRGSSILNYHKVLATGSISYTLPAVEKNQYYTGLAPLKSNVVFLTSASSSTNVDIFVNDKKVVSGIDLSEASSRIKIVEFDLPYSALPASILENTIKIVNNSATTHAYISCVNFKKLKDLNTTNYYHDSYAIFPSGRYYRGDTSTGASDYAIFDDDEQKWCGSFHGGEISESINIFLDGSSFNVSTPSQTSFIVKDVSVNQKTNIANKLTAYIDHYFNDCGYSLSVTLAGDINCSTIYTAMSITNPSFNTVEKPLKFDLSTVSIGSTLKLYDAYEIVQKRNAESVFPELIFTIEFTRFDSLKNISSEGAFLKKETYYNKPYYGPIINYQSKITDISFCSNHYFC